MCNNCKPTIFNVKLAYNTMTIQKTCKILTNFILTTIITKSNTKLIQCHNDVLISSNRLQNKYVK